MVSMPLPSLGGERGSAVSCAWASSTVRVGHPRVARAGGSRLGSTRLDEGLVFAAFFSAETFEIFTEDLAPLASRSGNPTADYPNVSSSPLRRRHLCPQAGASRCPSSLLRLGVSDEAVACRNRNRPRRRPTAGPQGQRHPRSVAVLSIPEACAALSANHNSATSSVRSSRRPVNSSTRRIL